MKVARNRHITTTRRIRRRRSLVALTMALSTVSLVAPAVVVSTAGGAAAAAPVGQGFNLNRSDLRFILRQIAIAERHASTRTAENPCGTLLGTDVNQIPNGNQQGAELPWGLRTVDGTCNNLIPGQEEFGAADTVFPRLVPGEFRAADTSDPDGPGPSGPVATSYAQKRGTVIDTQPRIVSNLIVDQTVNNPAAVAAAGDAVPDSSGTLPIPNTAPDVGLSAPFNSFFTLFGQFFDHGLDLVTKGGGTVYMPLQEDDPLYEPGSRTNFMVLTRAANQPGLDGVSGDDPATEDVDESADNVQEHTNTTTSFVDQNQTYTSSPSHQAFLREYVLDPGPDGIRGDDPATADVDESVDDTDTPVDTGSLLGGVGGEGLATWGGVKAEALSKLGIILEDTDVSNVPMLATDPYGNLELTESGRPQYVTSDGTVPTDPAGTPVPDNVIRTGHAFLDDIARHAVPTGDIDPADGPGPIVALTADSDTDSVADDGDRATYDDEMLNSHFVAGDGRVNENIGLTAVHQIFHAEHNRLVADIDAMINNTETEANIAAWKSTDGPAGWTYGQRLFQAARFVNEMEYQHLVFEEFGRKVQPMVNLFGGGGTGYRTTINPSIRAEFASAVYRFGHSMLTETVARRNADGSNNDVGLIEAFLNPQEFLDGGPAGPLSPDAAAGSIVRGMTRQVGNQIDEFVTEALRNNLLGLPLDLATINMARARDTGIPRLNAARRAFYDESANSAVAPYESWTDFNFSLRNPESLVNFIAAYGTHDDIVGVASTTAKRTAAQALLDLASTPPPVEDPATESDDLLRAQIQDAYDFLNGTGPWANVAGKTITGVDDIDLWMGGLAEKPMVFGGMLGATFNYVFEIQMEDLQDGDRFYYLSRTAGLNLLTQLEGNSFAELTMRNTDVEGLPADAFSRPDFVFEVANLGTTGAIVDDPATEWDESALLTRMSNGTVRFGGQEHVVFNGTAGPDRVWSSEGDDTIRGNDGNDWIQGGDGNDNHIGGLGDDILQDLAGDDVLKGGDGDDALSSGQGFAGDLNQGGRGKDFIVGGNDITETFAGPGDDFVFAGDAEDTVFGDDGDDWIEDGKGPFSLLQGDNGAPFQDDPNEPGHDVLNGDGGEQDYDAEGGDDVMMAGPGIQRNEGMLGFDWVTHKDDPLPADSDMAFTGLLPPGVETNRDRFDLVEGLSGWKFNDVLRGDDRTGVDLGVEHQLTQTGIDRVIGLAAVLPDGTTSYNEGNLIVGGAGSDVMEGRGGNDILDGDVWLNARLSVRTDPADPATEIGSANSMRAPYLTGSTTTLQQAVFAGTVDPGNIVIVREMLAAGDLGDVDAAVFTGPLDDYTFVVEGAWTTVTDTVGTDGVDRLRNVEALRFVDQTVDLAAVPSAPVIGTATAGDGSATVNFTAGADNGAQPTTEFRVQVLVGGVVVDTVTGIGPTATLAVISGLTNGTTYTFRVIAVNAVGESSPSAESNAVTPATTPLVITSSPADGNTGVLTSSNLSVVFDTPVQGVTTSSVTLTNLATNASVAVTLSMSPDSQTLTADPVADLAAGTQFRLSLLGTLPDGSTGINAGGMRLANTSITFTTSVDGVAPTVINTVPSNNATRVNRGADLRFNTSERVVGVTTATYEVRPVLAGGSLGAARAAVVSSNGAGTRWRLNPNTNLAGLTTYRVVLTSGSSAIRDVTGNPLVGNNGSATTFTWTFRTRR